MTHSYNIIETRSSEMAKEKEKKEQLKKGVKESKVQFKIEAASDAKVLSR